MLPPACRLVVAIVSPGLEGDKAARKTLLAAAAARAEIVAWRLDPAVPLPSWSPPALAVRTTPEPYARARSSLLSSSSASPLLRAFGRWTGAWT